MASAGAASTILPWYHKNIEVADVLDDCKIVRDKKIRDAQLFLQVFQRLTI